MEANKRLKEYYEQLKEKWLEKERTPGVFAYVLNITKFRRLPGECKFYCQLNPDRTILRRKPQEFVSLDPVFDENKFNFKKIKSQEILYRFEFNNHSITTIINRAPLTRFHSLICPSLEAGLPQKITKRALLFSINFLLSIDDAAIRLAYNSPGAAASVNHLHLHLVYINLNLYIDCAQLEILGDGDTFRLARNEPTEGVCFLFEQSSMDSLAIDQKIEKIFMFLQWLCERNNPHNICLSKKNGILKVFVFARENATNIKDLSFNIAGLEFSGYITVGDENLFNDLTEAIVLEKIKQITGDVYEKIYKYFECI